MGESNAVVVIENLTKKYGDFVALDSLTMSLERGQILGFIGPNGAGKTTTIKILVGQASPTSGSAHIAGVDCVRNSKKIKHLVGYMPDVFGSYDNMRVHEYLDFFGATFRIPRKKRRKRIEEVLEISGATYMKDRFVESLSHGMKQRVAIARTLLHDPEVLILDEPANGLDPQARIDMRDLLLHLAQMGKTLIVTSHILPEVSRICDQIAIITQGKLRAFGPLDDIMRRVSQRRMVEIQLLSAAEVEKAAELLRRVLKSKAEVMPAPAEAMVRFRSGLSEKGLRKLLAAMISTGLAISQFREVHSDLEDTFLSITQNRGATNGDKEVTPSDEKPVDLHTANEPGVPNGSPAPGE